jgi:hypothetical protein
MKMQSPSEADRRRRYALNISGQLPENVNDAPAILDLLRKIVVTFLHLDMPEPEKTPVVTLIRSRPDLSAQMIPPVRLTPGGFFLRCTARPLSRLSVLV